MNKIPIVYNNTIEIIEKSEDFLYDEYIIKVYGKIRNKWLYLTNYCMYLGTHTIWEIDQFPEFFIYNNDWIHCSIYLNGYDNCLLINLQDLIDDNSYSLYIFCNKRFPDINLPYTVNIDNSSLKWNAKIYTFEEIYNKKLQIN